LKGFSSEKFKFHSQWGLLHQPRKSYPTQFYSFLGGPHLMNAVFEIRQKYVFNMHRNMSSTRTKIRLQPAQKYVFNLHKNMPLIHTEIRFQPTQKKYFFNPHKNASSTRTKMRLQPAQKYVFIQNK
jgi:hypothetical protein